MGRQQIGSVSTFTVPFAGRGSWQTSTAYALGDVVDNDGASYLCDSAHTSGASTEPGTGASWETVWQLLAAKGDTGEQGPQGEPGEAGAGGALPLRAVIASAIDSNALPFALPTADRAGKTALKLRGIGNAGGGFDSTGVEIELYAGPNVFGTLIQTVSPDPDTWPGMGGTTAFTASFGIPDAATYADGRFCLQIVSAGGDTPNISTGMLVAE